MIEIASPKVGFKGKYRLQVRKAATDQLVRDTGEFTNLILDQGLNWLGNRQMPGIASAVDISRFFVGTGTAAPAVTDTAMGGVWKVNNTDIGGENSNTGAPDYVAVCNSTKRFSAGNATGTWTEVGIGAYVTSPTVINRLFSRALIVDGSGNPIAITVLADEYLDVTYTLELYAAPGDFSGSFSLSGVSYSYTGRRAYAANWAIGSSWSSSSLTLDPGTSNLVPPHFLTYYPLNIPSTAALGLITAGLTNSSALSSPSITFSEAAYVADSYTHSCTVTYSLGDANHANGIIGFLRGLTGYDGSSNYMRSGWQILLDKPIPKTSAKILKLDWTASWGRH